MPTEDPTDLDFTDIFAKREVAAPTPEQQAQLEANALIGANEVKKGGFCVSMARPGLRMRGPRPLHPTVLVVEDEPITSKLLERILTGAGYKPWIARSGKEVIEKLRSPPPPDLILMDVMLPDIEGFKIVERIRQHMVIGEIPVIMVSGRAELADVTRSFEVGGRRLCHQTRNARFLARRNRAGAGRRRVGQGAQRRTLHIARQQIVRTLVAVPRRFCQQAVNQNLVLGKQGHRVAARAGIGHQ